MVLIHSQIFFPLHVEMHACVLSHFSCIWLCDTMECSPPGSSVHGFLLARKLVWVAMPSTRGSSQPRDWTCVSCVSYIGRWVLTTSTTRAAPLSRYYHTKSSKEKIIICSQPSSIPHSGFPGGSVGKEPAFNAGNTGDTCSIPGSWRSPGFPGGTSGKEPLCQCRRHKRRGLDSWVGKIPWRRAWQPFPVFLPGKSHVQRSLAGYSS